MFEELVQMYKMLASLNGSLNKNNLYILLSGACFLYVENKYYHSIENPILKHF